MSVPAGPVDGRFVKHELVAGSLGRSLVLVVAVYAAWGLLTWYHASIPWPALMLLGGLAVAWQTSLQHEALHELLTPWRRIDFALASPPLCLWLPFSIYRKAHLAHHGGAGLLTDPRRDPESYYIAQERWPSLPPWWRAVLRVHHTLLGRLVLGPFLAIGQFLSAETQALVRGDRRHLQDWLWHAPGVALVLAWVVGVCAMPIGLYLLCFVLPGTSIMLIRSFAEHHARETPQERTALVEAGPVMSLLYLNNNLHAVHHERPDLPWHAIPTYYRMHRERLLRENGGLLYAGGYLEIAQRFLVRPVDEPRHPFL